jgi:hypothetical protein
VEDHFKLTKNAQEVPTLTHQEEPINNKDRIRNTRSQMKNILRKQSEENEILCQA